jgi:hypothetical protein
LEALAGVAKREADLVGRSSIAHGLLQTGGRRAVQLEQPATLLNVGLCG